LTTHLTEAEILQACQTLFGSEVNICRNFLFYLQPEGVKSAYRKKAKQTHPDFFAQDAPHVQKTQSSLFRDVVEAYEMVTLFCKQREQGVWRLQPHVQAAPRKQPENRPPGRANHPANGNEHAETVYHKPLPLQPLPIGRYLYYRGFITYRTLIDAVVWQRKQRPVIGEIALRWGWLNAGAIERVLRAGRGLGRFGENAVGLDLLSSFQVKVLLFFQNSQQERFGAYFVQKNILTPEEIECLVEELGRHNANVQHVMARNAQRRNAYV
jgi:hypothetical protein